MRVKHIRSLNLWLVSRGNRLLYHGKENPWQDKLVLESALKIEGIRF